MFDLKHVKMAKLGAVDDDLVSLKLVKKGSPVT
jgi:hypothetical protein